MDFVNSNENQYKIILIGDPATGKTSILRRYCDNTFDDNYKCSIGVQFKIKVLRVNSGVVRLQLWDIAGQKRFQEMTRSYYRCAEGCVMVYDITRRETFDHLPDWYLQFENNVDSKKSILFIIGNKTDLENEREVSYAEAKNYAKKIGALYCELSAKTDSQRVIEFFEAVAKKINDMPKKVKKNKENDLDSVILRTQFKTNYQEEKKCCK